MFSRRLPFKFVFKTNFKSFTEKFHRKSVIDTGKTILSDIEKLYKGALVSTFRLIAQFISITIYRFRADAHKHQLKKRK